MRLRPLVLPFAVAFAATTAFASGQDASSRPASAAATTPTPAVAPASRRAADYVPLAPGRRWNYASEIAGGDRGERREACLLRVSVKGEGVVHELRTHEGRGGFAYRGLLADGAYEWPNALLGGLRGVARDGTPTPILLDPIEAGRSWTRAGTLTVQTEESVEAGEADAAQTADAPDPSLRYVSTWTIEAVDEQVVVPAGTFSCVRVVRVDRGAHWRNERRSWFAAGVGLVQETLRSRWNDDETFRTDRLVEYRPADAATRARTAEEVAATLGLLPDFLARGGKPRVRRLSRPELDDAFHAAFFVVTAADGSRRAVYYATPVPADADAPAADGARVSRAHGGTLGPLAATEAGGFAALLAADVFVLRERYEGAEDAASLARVAAIVLGASRGDEFADAPLPTGGVSSTTIDARGAIEARAAVRGTSVDGRAYYAIVTAKVAGGVLRDLSVKEGL